MPTYIDDVMAIYEVRPLFCPRCGEAMRIIAFFNEPKVVCKILQHLAAKGVEALSPLIRHNLYRLSG